MSITSEFGHSDSGLWIISDVQFPDDLPEVMALPLRPAATQGDWVISRIPPSTMAEICHTHLVSTPPPRSVRESRTGRWQPALQGAGWTLCTHRQTWMQICIWKVDLCPAWDSHKSKMVSVYSRVHRESCWESPKHLKILYGNQENFIWRQEIGRTNRPRFSSASHLEKLDYWGKG